MTSYRLIFVIICSAADAVATRSSRWTIKWCFDYTEFVAAGSRRLQAFCTKCDGCFSGLCISAQVLSPYSTLLFCYRTRSVLTRRTRSHRFLSFLSTVRGQRLADGFSSNSDVIVISKPFCFHSLRFSGWIPYILITWSWYSAVCVRRCACLWTKSSQRTCLQTEFIVYCNLFWISRLWSTWSTVEVFVKSVSKPMLEI